MSAQPDYAHNSFAEARRLEKAVRLETFLRSRGITAGKAERMVTSDRRFTERAAGVRRCSDETWCLVVQLIRKAEEPAPPPVGGEGW